MLYFLAVHVFMSWLCAYLKGRKKKSIGIGGGFEYGAFVMCLCGGWFIVPESWDNSWMDKYKEQYGESE